MDAAARAAARRASGAGAAPSGRGAAQPAWVGLRGRCAVRCLHVQSLLAGQRAVTEQMLHCTRPTHPRLSLRCQPAPGARSCMAVAAASRGPACPAASGFCLPRAPSPCLTCGSACTASWLPTTSGAPLHRHPGAMGAAAAAMTRARPKRGGARRCRRRGGRCGGWREPTKSRLPPTCWFSCTKANTGEGPALLLCFQLERAAAASIGQPFKPLLHLRRAAAAPLLPTTGRRWSASSGRASCTSSRKCHGSSALSI